MSISQRVPGAHYEGPILGSDRSVKGLFEDIPLAAIDVVRSPYKVYVEDFNHAVASGATGIAEMGWTITDLNTAGTPTTAVLPEDGYLLVNPGTKDDAGTQFQKILVPSQATYKTPAHNVLGPITSTSTLMDGKEIFFYTRVAVMSATTAWDAKALIGWYTTDTTLMATAGGLPTVVAGGGFGFHIGEDGVISFHCSPDAITTAGTASNHTVPTLTASTPNWYTLGARMRVVDADASTGQADFYINGIHVGTIANATCMDSTEEFAYSIVMMNGDSGADHDLPVDYIITGITRNGLTYPYSSGIW